MTKNRALIGLLAVFILALALRPDTEPREMKMVQAARECLGDIYDSELYPGGPPPKGRGACTDVVYRACLPVVNLQHALNQDREANPGVYGQSEPNPDLDWVTSG